MQIFTIILSTNFLKILIHPIIICQRSNYNDKLDFKSTLRYLKNNIDITILLSDNKGEKSILICCKHNTGMICLLKIYRK